MFLTLAMLAIAVQEVPAAPSTAAAPEPARRVCRSVTSTGSRLARRTVCQTARERKMEADETARDLQADRQTSPALGQ